jgi:hypothetical protein
MSLEKRARRLKKQLLALEALEKSPGKIVDLAREVLDEFGDDWKGLPQFVRDAEWAGEISYRVDKMIEFDNEIVEMLDGVVVFFVALGAIGIVRGRKAQKKRISKKLEKVEKRLKTQQLA